MAGRALIIQPLPGIGDMLWFMPAIRAIADASEDKKISILAKPSSQALKLLGHEPFLDEVIDINVKLAKSHPIKWTITTATKIRKKDFKTVYILHHSPRYAMLSLLSGIPNRYGYGFGLQKLFLNSGNYLESKDYKLHNIDKSYKFLQLNNLHADPQMHRITSNPSHDQMTDNLNLHKPWFTFGISATEQRRIWPSTNFAELARQLLDKYGGSVILLGANSDLHIAQSIQGITPSCVNFIGHQLDESIAIIAKSDMFIGNDSGLMNIAASLGVKTFGIFRDKKVLNYVDNLYAVYPDTDGIENVTVDGVLREIHSHQKLVSTPGVI